MEPFTETGQYSVKIPLSQLKRYFYTPDFRILKDNLWNTSITGFQLKKTLRFKSQLKSHTFLN